MIVWGGYQGGDFNDGAQYSPVTNTWTAISAAGAPSTRSQHSAVWTGSEMIIYGGTDNSGFNPVTLNDGGRYSPATNTSSTSAPGPARGFSMRRCGQARQMVVWGGSGAASGNPLLTNGGRYNPAANAWTTMTSAGAPSGRRFFTAIWTGSEMIVWGGSNSSGNYLSDGGRYNPSTDN